MLRKTLAGLMPTLLVLILAAGCGPSAGQQGGPAAAGTAEPQGGAAAQGTTRPGGPAAVNVAPAAVPRPDHLVIVVEENREYDQIIGSTAAPYINQLARDGVLLTDAHAVAHPSQPNYLALFSGSTQGIGNDSCPHTFSGANLASALKQKGLTFGGYSESLPEAGFTGCQSGAYRRKHNPWVNFSNVDAAVNMPFSSFPADYSRLPTVSFVVPDLNDDMHDGPVPRADQWLKEHLDGYVQWAKTHNSLLLLTWDEGTSSDNRIVTIFVGAGVKPGTYGGRVDQYDLLRTIEAIYGLSRSGGGAGKPITGIWG